MPERLALICFWWLHLAAFFPICATPLYASEAFATQSKGAPGAIGAMRHSGKHLAQPRPDYIDKWARKHAAGEGEKSERWKKAARLFHEGFSRESSAWVSPRVESEAFRKEAAGARVSRAMGPATSAAAEPVTVSILGLAVDFAGTDTFDAWTGSPCARTPVTASGPRRGEVPYPGHGDNNTIWYDPSATKNTSFYEKLIFGYEGAGRVRTDLVDPGDKLPGIDLAGYTVQDYFDHMAGKDNVLFHGQIEGWISVDHSEAYYGADLCTARHDAGGPATPFHLVVDALRKFNDAHPGYYSDTGDAAFWKKFDADGDGIVDVLLIVHAGKGQEADGGAQGDFAIWSHTSDLRNHPLWPAGFKVYEGDPSTTEDDIVAGPYSMVPEDVGLGFLIEEFGHGIFGLPDLYTSDTENSIGFWGPMSAGTWAGPLGSAVPVEMPLWLRMIARCGDKFCNWDQPIFTCANNDFVPEVAIGKQQEPTSGAYKGIRIDLPDVIADTTANLAGPGKGAYSGSDDDLDVTLDRDIAIGASETGILKISAQWDIEEHYDYGYVMVRDESGWHYLMDSDKNFRTDNPYGKNEGIGLTGTGNGILRFNLSKYRGKTVKLRLRYKTDSSVANPGWWVDSVRLNGVLLDNFNTASAPGGFPGWVNSSPGWAVVPSPSEYKNYYLLEWRGPSKYDGMLRTAYTTVYSTSSVWKVKRTPYHIPGALLTYRNQRYSSSYRLVPNNGNPPSFGPKHQLLVVDMNYGPMFLGDSGIELSPKVAGYDAALTLDRIEPLSISTILINGEPLTGPWLFRGKLPVKQFDDSKGYYAGFYAGEPCPAGQICPKNGLYGSAVIPANGPYSTRITHYDGTPYPELYGYWNYNITLGTGKPGDEGAQQGVRVNLLSKDADDLGAVLRINPPAEPDLTFVDMEAPPSGDTGDRITIHTRVENIGFRDSGPFEMRAYLAPKAYPSASRSIGSKVVDTVLQAGTVKRQILSKIPTDLPSGNYILTVIIDAENKAPEIDKANNSISSEIMIRNIGPYKCFYDWYYILSMLMDKLGYSLLD
ncbi:MAG: M6 family metalloprotease domain-containing protein [Syntrophobacteraceae bacterium]